MYLVFVNGQKKLTLSLDREERSWDCWFELQDFQHNGPTMRGNVFGTRYGSFQIGDVEKDLTCSSGTPNRQWLEDVEMCRLLFAVLQTVNNVWTDEQVTKLVASCLKGYSEVKHA